MGAQIWLSSGAERRRMIDRAASFDIRFRRILLQKSGDDGGGGDHKSYSK
jgi:hypothetical protein